MKKQASKQDTVVIGSDRASNGSGGGSVQLRHSYYAGMENSGRNEVTLLFKFI